MLALCDRLGQIAIRQVVFIFKLHECKVTAGSHRSLRPVLSEGVTLVVENHIPDGFIAITRDRKRGSASTADNAIAARRELRLASAFLGFFVMPFRIRGSAARRKDIELIGRILFQHRQLPRREVILVLIRCRGGDREQRLVIRKRIRICTARFKIHTSRNLGDATIPCRDRACRISRFFSAHWGQRRTEFCKVAGSKLRKCANRDGQGPQGR